MSLPSGGDWNKNDPPARGDEGHWDPSARILLMGVLLPLGLAAWVIFDLWHGYIWLPGRGFDGGEVFRMDRQPMVFWGIELIKLAAAGLAFDIWVLGNHPRLGWHTHWIALILFCLIVTGLALAFAGVLL